MFQRFHRITSAAARSVSARRAILVNVAGLLLPAYGSRASIGASGGEQIGYNAGITQSGLENGRPLANYTALRGYRGPASGVRITDPGLAGTFYRDKDDVVSADNGCTTIVDALGHRWKRLYDGAVMGAWAGVVGDGVTDDTTALQTWLDVAGNLASAPGKTYRTSATLFNQHSDRAVDFAGSKIINTSGSQYAIVTISSALATRTPAALRKFMTELHYGEEIKSSHIQRLVIQMSPSSSSGSNLGVGIVFGERCIIDGAQIVASNGNGIEVRNSICCDVVDSLVSGHRNYGVFFFQSKLCRTRRTTIKGGSRGWISKHCHNGTGLTENILEDSTLIDASSVGRYIVGGEWFEDTLTEPIYVLGHEVVRGNIVRRNKLYATKGDAPRIGLGYYADKWEFYDNDFYCNSRRGNVFTTGAEGNIASGGIIGGYHRFWGNRIHNVSALGNAVFATQVPTDIADNNVTGKWGYLLIANAPASHTNALVRFSKNQVRGNQSATNLGESGIVLGSSVAFAVVDGNDIGIDAVGTPAVGAKAVVAFVVGSAQWVIRRNRIFIAAQDGSLDTSAYGLFALAGGGMMLENSFALSASASVVGAYFARGATGGVVAERNTFNLIGSPSSTVRALVTDVEVRQVGNLFNDTCLVRPEESASH